MADGGEVEPPDRAAAESGRGGRQVIPRPPGVRPGSAPEWAGLGADARHFTLADVRDRLLSLPPPRASELDTPQSRAAAVLVPVFEADGEARIILTKRPDTMPSHRGEIAFPGGKRESGDASMVAAALREAEEEIGLAPEMVEVAGELDSLSTVASQFTITPIVGLLTAAPVLRPDPREVAAAFSVPISELLDPAAYREELWDLWDAWRPMAFFDLPGETVWGATARILAGFLRFLTGERLRAA
jgi:8-oxo-dGTP pyrophosphatase MutT (NUDIX family)